ncbi:MAG: rRNA biogenesis protein rrp5 [Bathelium mastoideum]|nr:MAG: rRNA biogenesis protein rrp5 [Bathelium mastoideum]
MAPVKRRVQLDSSGRDNNESMPKKVRKQSPNSHPKSKVPASSPPPQKKNVQPSLLKNDERSFPRGGASALTPLEHKQIQIEAERDVLFENRASKAYAEGDDASDKEDTGGLARQRTKQDRASKKRKRSQPSLTRIAAPSEDSVKIESPSFRRLVPGSLVLGQVTRISPRDVALTLPNNLTGYVPLTSISDKLNQRIETVLASSDGEESDDAQDGGDIDLKDYFRIGQYLRACVTSNVDDDMAIDRRKFKRRIELTLDPRQTNVEVAGSDVAVGSTMQAVVVSIEDRGFVMDIAIKNQSLKGFVPIQELDPNIDPTTVKEGTVWLCLVTGMGSNGKTAQLSANHQRAGDIRKSNFVSDVPKLDNLLPGTAVQVLVTSTSSAGICGKIAGLVDVTADWIHSGVGNAFDTHAAMAKVGSKAKARIICTFPDEEKKVIVSFLGHVLSLSHPTVRTDVSARSPLDVLPLSTVVDVAKVMKVVPKLGLVLDLGNDLQGFAHMSRLSDDRVDSLSETTGSLKIGSVHRARILSYNSMDGHFILSLEPKIIEQPFLRLEDIRVGQLVEGTIEKLLITAEGIGGLLVNLADGISALVPEAHFSDVKLRHPERKFKEGMHVSARVLSADLEKRSMKLTLKKALVNSRVIWTTYQQVSVGSQSVGTLISISQGGAVVQFFGNVRAFLPVSEMSEAYIKDPREHFHVGQIVTVYVRSVDPEHEKMTVSCRDPSQSGAENQAGEGETIGSFVEATVTEKTDLHFTLQITRSGRPAILRLGHLTDGTEQKDKSAWKRMHIGQKLQDLLVLTTDSKRQIAVLSRKPSLLKAARASQLPWSFQDLQANQFAEGFVRNVTTEAVFVEFGGGLVGLLPKKQLTDEMHNIPNFSLRLDQSIKVRVRSLDHQLQRFTLSMKEEPHGKDDAIDVNNKKDGTADGGLSNPVDGHSTSMADFTLGARTQARINAVKETQLNVQLADRVHGRIDISEVFDKWEDIQDKKKPLSSFKKNQVIAVKIIGIHNSRTHRFLPISHRQGGTPVFELTAKPAGQSSDGASFLTLTDLSVGSSVVAFVNNITDTHIWTTVSPSVHGRIELLDLADDVSKLKDLTANFPPGTALLTHVKNIDLSNNRLDLIAIPRRKPEGLALDDISEGMILPGQVTKTAESALIVRLSHSVVGTVGMTQVADDYLQADLSAFRKNEIIRVCVLEVDAANQKVTLSTRPSKVLSSSLPVTDPHISAVSQLKVNDVIRGFVKHFSEKGVFVRLSPNVVAFVRVSDLSDAYLKDWKAAFKIDQLVQGKLTVVDEKQNFVQMSLKASMLDKDYVAPISFEDVQQKQIVSGRIRKVEDFGVFIVIDNSRNVSGLCHRSEMADGKVADVRKLYEEGDQVKAIVLKVDREKRRINFGLKASYFQDEAAADDAMDLVDGEDSGSESGVRLGIAMEGGNPDLDTHELDLVDGSDLEDENDEVDALDASDDNSDDDSADINVVAEGLSTGGFDWDGIAMGSAALEKDVTSAKPSDVKANISRKRKAHGSDIDRTGTLDSQGPQSADDFERQLLGQPNSSALWVQYMAYHLQLSDIDSARAIAERALKTINMREEDEKANVWTALLNLETTYGDDDDDDSSIDGSALDAVFRRACTYADSQTMHIRFASILIDAGKHARADALFQSMIRNKAFAPDPGLWLNYATFLMTTRHEPERARGLLSRACQSVPERLHRYLTARFAALEFASPQGERERGRTILEGLLAAFPKRGELWDQFVALERGKGEDENVRRLFERMTAMGEGGPGKMKARRAGTVFKRWVEFEEERGTERQVGDVRRRAEEYAEWLKGERGEG